MIYQAIGLGLLVSLAFTELLGLAAGGLIVPGYIAMYLDKPWQIFGTIMASLITYVTVKLLGRIMLLYGRRTMIVCVLVGFIFGLLTRYLPTLNTMMGTGIDFSVMRSIGYIIPGLIAYWMYRQGVVSTLSTMLVAAFIVRLALVLAYGGRWPDVALG